MLTKRIFDVVVSLAGLLVLLPVLLVSGHSYQVKDAGTGAFLSATRGQARETVQPA
jgi:lipopolysaccharide/colanic/teichoic acid biosynthesis glycosyltransferase